MNMPAFELCLNSSISQVRNALSDTVWIIGGFRVASSEVNHVQQKLIGREYVHTQEFKQVQRELNQILVYVCIFFGVT